MSVPKNEPSTKRPRRRALWLLGGLVVTATLIWVLRWSRSDPAPQPLPVPNGYDDFVAAGRAIVGKVPADGQIDRATPDELRDWVAQNAEPLARIRQGLSRDCLVPVDYQQMETTIADAGPIRMAARLLAAQAAIEADEARTADAASSLLDIIRYAQKSTRGGLMIHRQTALAIEDGYGLGGIRRLQPSLSATEARDVAKRLLELDASRGPVDDTLQVEALWRRRSLSTFQRGMLTILTGPANLPANVARMESMLENQNDRVSTSARTLALELALQAYRADHSGASPPDLAALVPDYLPSLPKQPTTGLTPILRPGVGDQPATVDYPEKPNPAAP